MPNRPYLTTQLNSFFLELVSYYLVICCIIIIQYWIDFFWYPGILFIYTWLNPKVSQLPVVTVRVCYRYEYTCMYMYKIIAFDVQVWQCGGRVETSPCSHVAHVFRKSSPYSFPGGVDKILYSNLARVALVWMDEWKEFYFKLNPGSWWFIY